MNAMTIIPFEEQYTQDFYELNVEWLKAFFYVEPHDEEVLSQPKKYIMDPGGYIFFVKIHDEIVATVALIKMKENIFELSKMAVLPKLRGQKIGQHLLQYCLDFSKENKFEKLILYSNRKLKNALYIYEKYGFVEIPIEENNPYDRGDIKMELLLDC
ncbi:GNAT family N-acetyltransferase [Kordia sp. SMS9]|uniref:GNAT family N-acetyltransferase n=1 Tax=Kordia sp. SMS9 TaxID=2282170 RepID=UPI000E0D1DA2|nr:GNAT family N-acetyltransferase [Kordia sp. SMS9]